jgi:hypothetical protein
MSSIFREFFLRNTPDKIVAVSFGLAVCSTALFTAALVELDRWSGAVVIDDHFFGFHSRPLAVAFFAIDAVLMTALAWSASRRSTAVLRLGIPWTVFLLVESLFDLFAFADDLHMLVEEMAFVGIYAALLGLLVSCRRVRY